MFFVAFGRGNLHGSHPVWDGVAEFRWGERPDASEAATPAEEAGAISAAELQAPQRSEEQSRAANSGGAVAHQLKWPPDISHGLRLRNSADAVAFSEYFTNYTRGFKDILDYIFIDKDVLQVQRVLPFPTIEEISAEIALPSSNQPSDHVAVVVDLKFC
jgi:hypothetical protein